MAEFSPRQKEVLDLMKRPAADVFGQFGIKLKSSKAKGYQNVSRCPWCGHGDEKNPNYQCGVRSSPGNNGGLIHSYKCQHPHHSPTGDDTPHYAEVLASLGALSDEEAGWVQNLKASLQRSRMLSVVKAASSDLRPANKVFRERLHKRLNTNPAALAWLMHTRGYSPAVIEHFQLGLTESYIPSGTKEVQTSDALAAPLVAQDGKFYAKYVNYAVPGVTQDNRTKKLKAWSAGPARTYYSASSAKKTRLFVCDGLKDLWALWDNIRSEDWAEDLLLVSSTNGGSGYPEEWKDASFWEGWSAIYLGHDNDAPDQRTGKKAGDEHAKSIARMAMREMRRVWPVGFKDWNDFFLAGKSAEDFRKLLDEAYPLSLKELKDDGPGKTPGLHAAVPVAIAGNFHNGYLYEAVDVLETTIDPDTGQHQERIRTVVVRSDGTLHSVATMAAPKGTKQNQLVRRLVPDGTLLEGDVKPSPYCSWSWNSIQNFLDGKTRKRSLKEMLLAVRGHLKASIWLPFEDDYTLLACTAVATYVQTIFDAVPLLLATGAPGSGKTQLGIALSEVCANSPKSAIGQISAASIARLIDQSRGFVVLDDLESVGGKRNGDAQFDDLVQALKLSYNKQSAVKFWTNMKTNSLERLNFFGIKLINNTRGVDAILGSRMFTIATRRMPEGMSLSIEGKLNYDERVALRDDLHTWAFTSAAEVARAYSQVFPNKTSRADEIAAPLKVITLLAEDESMNQSLESALSRQAKLDIQPETPEELTREALEEIILRTFEERGVIRTVLTITELMMKMAQMVEKNYGKTSTTDLSDIESPEVVGRFLKQNFTKIDSPQLRVQMYGKYLRAYQLDESFVRKTLRKRFSDNEIKGVTPIEDPKEFCRGCASCEYKERCSMRSTREAKDGAKLTRTSSDNQLSH